MVHLVSVQLAKKYHPDVNKDSQAQTNFQEVSEAYEVSSRNDTDDTTQQLDAINSTGQIVCFQVLPCGKQRLP